MNSASATKKGLGVIWLALLGLLFLTWLLARIDLGPFNTAAALLIAAAKAALVILIFMEVRFHSHSVWVFAAAGFFWILIMITLTLSDYATRSEIKPQPPINLTGPRLPMQKNYE